MSRQIRLVFIMFCISLLLGAGILVLNATEKEQSNGQVVFCDFPPNEVRTVRIDNTYGTMQIDYMDGGYVVGDVPIDIVDMNRFVEMMTYSGAVCAVNTVASPSDIAQYGLDNSLASVEITYADGEDITLHIGNPEPISNGYYCMVEGDVNVYVFEQERIDAYLQPNKYYVSNYVTPPIPQQSQSSLGHVLGVRFEGGLFEQPIELIPVTSEDEQSMLDAISYGSATHLIEICGMKHRVDQRYAEEIFDSLVGLSATDIVQYNATEQQMNAFGFDCPDMTVWFEYRQTPDEAPQEYVISLIENNGEFYAACNNRSVIYRVRAPSFYGIDIEKLPVRWFFSPLLFDLDELEITAGDEIYRFEVNGSTNSDLSVKCNGQAFDLDRFRTLYKLITSAAHDNTMSEERTPEGQPILQIMYRYRNAEKPDDVLKLYPAEARRMLVEVNGLTKFTIKEQFAQRVIQALAVLYTDETIEIDW